LLKFDIPVISYSYLAERLFDLLDDSSDGRIQEEEFISGMKNVFGSHEIREKRKHNL
jgi:Ca2+-binding EF-hand superfamily protein